MRRLRNLARPKPLLFIWALLQHPILMWDIWFPEPDGLTICSFYPSFLDTPFWLVLSLVIAAAGLWYGKVWSNLLALAFCSDIIYRQFDFFLQADSESRVLAEGGGINWFKLLNWWKLLAEYNPIYLLQILTTVAILLYATVCLVGAIRKQRLALQ